MSAKQIDVPGIGTVTCSKSTRNRSLRLSVSGGKIRLSMPRWVSDRAGIAYVVQNGPWITEQLSLQKRPLLLDGAKLGKRHTLQFQLVAAGAPLHTRVTPTRVIVPHHVDELPDSAVVQARAEKAAVRALSREAEVLLPPRLHELARAHGLSFRSVHTKPLKRRWGSCDSHANITLNIYLVQLSWQQIDYVLCHELAHTVHMNHTAAFWSQVEAMLPDAKMIAKRVRYIQPALQPRVDTGTARDLD